MKIKKISFKNFGSYGNSLKTIVFPEKSFNLIYGFNGSGKSTIINVIKFALYGTLPDKNLKEIENRFNKNCFVSIEFESDGIQYKIERGVSNNVLKFYSNGVLLDFPSKKETQNQIQKVLKIEPKIFFNSIAISLNDFKSFLSLTPKDKRDIVDKLLNLDEYGIIKDEILKIQKNLENKLQILNEKIKMLEAEIEQNEIKKKEKIKVIEEQSKIEVDGLKTQIQQLELILKEKQNDLEIQTKEIESKISFLKQLKNENSDLNVKIKMLEEKLEVYQQGICPTCSSDLKDDFHLERKLKYEKELENFRHNFETNQTKIKELESLIKNELKVNYEKQKTEIENTKRDILVLKNKIKEIESDKNKFDVVKFIEDTNKLKKEELEKTKIDLNKILKNLERVEFTNTLFSEKTIKNSDFIPFKFFIYSNFIPIFNKEIENILSEFELSQYDLKFDVDFETRIKLFGEEVSIATLSTGERKILDFVVLISILKFIKLKFNNVNVLFLDEVFSSVDLVNIENIIEILKSLRDRLGLNVFIIHHANLPYSSFDNVVFVKKEKHFSSISINSRPGFDDKKLVLNEGKL